MKKLLFTGILCLLATNVFAGTSENDPMIRQLRERFEAAQAPTASDLNIGRQWNCTGFSGGAREFGSVTNQGLTFLAFDGIVQNKEAMLAPEPVDNFYPINFSFQDVGLVSVGTYGKNKNLLGYVVVRIDSNGQILAEWLEKGLTAPGEQLIQRKEMENGISYPDAKASAYSICIQK